MLNDKEFYVDEYYHRKVCEGTLTITDSYLRASEIKALTSGRYRGDGRRTDRWVIEEPIDMENTGWVQKD
jgi:hypothetical protein